MDTDKGMDYEDDLGVEAEVEDVRDAKPPTKLKYIIEGVMPASQVHLIGGPSGSGKTTLVFQMFKALTAGVPFLGYRTAKVKWAYISGDRSTASVEETQRRVGVAFPVFSLVDEQLVGKDLLDIMPRLTKFYGYRPDFVYVDGFTSMAPGGGINNYLTVAQWLAKLQWYCWKKGITILGACHTTKTKEGEKFLNPRQKIAGSIAWAGFSETVLIIEPPDKDITGDKRILMILPRNGKNEQLVLKFDDEGMLQIPPRKKEKEEMSGFMLDMTLMPIINASPDYVTYKNLRKAADGKGTSRSTLDRWIQKALEGGILRRKEKGMYELVREGQSVAESSGGETRGEASDISQTEGRGVEAPTEGETQYSGTNQGWVAGI